MSKERETLFAMVVNAFFLGGCLFVTSAKGVICGWYAISPGISICFWVIAPKPPKAAKDEGEDRSTGTLEGDGDFRKIGTLAVDSGEGE